MQYTLYNNKHEKSLHRSYEMETSVMQDQRISHEAIFSWRNDTSKPFPILLRHNRTMAVTTDLACLDSFCAFTDEVHQVKRTHMVWDAISNREQRYEIA